MDANSFFSATYAEARDKFLAAARSAGARIDTIPHPLTGPDGGPLATDVAVLGPADASRRLVLLSATHGVEGHFGSGNQVGLLGLGDLSRLPPDLSVVVVHAINPHGFAWTRRVTEENVDLNRNFVDFDAPLPSNPAYVELADAINPKSFDPETAKAARQRLSDFAKTHGAMAMQAAVSSGQYTHSDGVWFGGTAPTWSRRTLEEIVRRRLAGAARVVLVDFHTGLGPYGHGELITEYEADDHRLALARDWFGAGVTSMRMGDSTSAPLTGTIPSGLARLLAPSWLFEVSLEFGTRDTGTVLDAVRKDNWLHLHGRLDSEEGRAIKALIRDAFYPDEDPWREKALARGREVVGKAIAGLAALPAPQSGE